MDTRRTIRGTVTDVHGRVHTRRCRSQTTVTVHPSSAAIPATAEEGFLRAHALRLVPGTEAGVEVVVWCGDVAFPILRPEAWQKIFAYDCATSHWPAEFPGCPPPAPHESPRAFGRRALPVAREVLPELARRDGARGVTEAQWLRCAGDWLRAVWGSLPLWGADPDAKLKEELQTGWGLREIQRRVYAYWLGVVAPAFRRCAGCHRQNGTPLRYEAVWVLKALLARHARGPNPVTDQLLDAHGLHRYLLWEHQKLAWAQQALHRKGQGPTAQSLGPVLHSLVRGFQADSRPQSPLPRSGQPRSMTPREYWESIPRVTRESHPELYQDRMGLWWFC
eukprot:EG_transcript_17231